MNKTLLVVILVSTLALGCGEKSTNGQNKLSSVDVKDTLTDSVNIRFQRMKAAAVKCNLLGLWIDTDESSKLAKKTGYKLAKGLKGQFYIANCDPDSDGHSKGAITLIDALAAEVKRNKNRFTDIETGEYFIITNSGDLSIYDNYGLVTTCKKVF